MRPWKIVLASAVVAIAATVGVARPELTATPQVAVIPHLLPLLPTLAVAGLAVYALSAILLTAGTLIANSLRLRYVDRDAMPRGRALRGRRADLGAGELRALPSPLVGASPPPQAVGLVDLPSRFRPEEVRREAARLFYVWAARTHFFSTLILLTAAVALGEAQHHASLSMVPGPIPTDAALLAVAGLVLVALLARIAVDITIEPLAEAVAPLSVEPPESYLLHRAMDLLEAARAAPPAPAPSAAPTAVAPQLPDRLVSVLEQGHRALSKSIEQLSATTEKTAAATRSSIDGLEAAFRAVELNPLTMPGAPAEMAGLSELREAVTALTAVLERVLRVPASSGERTVAGTDHGSPSPDRGREPDLAQELKKLLQEIETAP